MKKPVCLWTEDEDGDWETKCGNFFCYISKVVEPKERPGLQGFAFCPYCARKIRTKNFVAEPWQ